MGDRAVAGLTVGRTRSDLWGKYRTLRTCFDPEFRTLTYAIQPDPRPCFSRKVLEDIHGLQCRVRSVTETELQRVGMSPVKFLVATSDAADGVHFGGDLEFFLKSIRDGDRDALYGYCRLGIDVLYQNLTNLGVDITTIAQVRGATLGAGFEAALSCDAVVADERASMGFPEILFNMFPGMGAYSFLSRRIQPALAERMITSGKTYAARDLYEMGIVDVVSDAGGTDVAVRRFIRGATKRENTRRAVLKLRSIVNPVTYTELLEITELWVDTAFRLTDYNLGMMERLLYAQKQRGASVWVSTDRSQSIA